MFNIKKSVAFFLVLMMVGTNARGIEGIASKSAILMDESGVVLYEKNADEPLEPASVTKIMTMLLVCEAIDSGKVKKEDIVTASKHATSMGGSQVYLKEGEQMTVNEMLKCLAVVSANDCAVALAEHISGSEGAFVERMNERAKELGMLNTHFVNTNGLPAQGHLSTARDIATMTREIIKHDMIYDYTTIWIDSIRDGKFQLVNTNSMIKSYPGMTGMKTGYTASAGFCLSSTATRGELDLIAVTMKADTKNARSADISALLNFGFANYTVFDPSTKFAEVEIPVILGKSGSCKTSLAQQEPIVVEKAALEGMSIDAVLPEKIYAPVKVGEKIGSFFVKSGDKIIKEIDIISQADIEKVTVLDIFKGILSNLCGKGEVEQ